jgi:carboxymethylenebutenolidase
VNTKYDVELVADYDATVDFVRASGRGDLSRMAITGFCRGGRTPLVYAASNPRLKAVVSWYGPVGGALNEYTPRTVMDRVDEIKVPVLGLYGAQDAGVPIVEVEKFFAALKRMGTPCELVVYPEAGHGFHADFRPDNYRKADAEDGWRRMLAWFQKYGV